MSSSNIYNILSKLNALQPKAEEPKAQATKPIYESVEPRGSIMSGVNRLEKKLSEQFAADKKALDTNPKNAAWDDDAGAKQRARIAREKQKIGMQRKISGQDTGLPPAMAEGEGSNEMDKVTTSPYKANQMLGGKYPVAFVIEVLCPDQSVVNMIQNKVGTAYQVERDDSIEGNGIGIEIISQRFDGGQAAQAAYNQLLNFIEQSGGQFNSSTQVTIYKQKPGVAEDEEGDVCPECDGTGCPECYGDEHRDHAHDHAQGMQRENAGMAESSTKNVTGVMKKYLPKSMWAPILSHTGKSKHDNADGSKTSHVWRLRNLVRSFRGREFDAWKQAVEQELGDGYEVTSEWPTPSVRYIQMNEAHIQTGVTETADVKYGVFAKGGSIGSQRFKDDPLKTFDSKEEAIADAKRRRSGLSKGERGYYRMGYVVKPIKGVAEGFADMEADVKRRDAERRSGKKATATGVKHHGKYGTEYQGDADEEEAAAKAADKGPKKRGRPAKGLAKPKPAADEKKGRGRPKKAADPTYSGAKDLQNYVVGNLPKGKQAKGKVYKMDESRMLDEAGQHLDHILNRFKHEVRKFEETGDLDQDSDLYHALHDYYKETGLLPYDIEKGRGVVSTLTWVADQLEQHLGISEETVAPAAGQPLPGLGQGVSHIDATHAAQFKPGSNVLIGGRMPAVVKSVSGTTATIYDPANPAAPFNIETSKLQAAPAAAPAAPTMEAELNELAKLAGLTVEAKVKPDYIDLDKDGNKKEPMSQAAQDAEDDDHDYANRLDDEQMDENIPVHKHVDGPFDSNSTSDDDEEGDVCPECDGAGCPECHGDEHRDRAHAHAQGMQRESAVREAEEMINFMRNAGLDTSRAESALAEAYKYGDTDVEEAPEYANSPDEEIQNVEAITRQGNDLNREKKQFAGKPKAGDNPMASESTDPLEAMGRRLMAAYESIKVVDEGMVDKVKGMFGKKKDPNAVPNIFDTEPYKSDTKAYLKKSAKQPGGPNNIKNIFDK